MREAIHHCKVTFENILKQWTLTERQKSDIRQNIFYLEQVLNDSLPVDAFVKQGNSQPMQGCGHVRTLPEQKPRVETGRLKFGNDWTGLFLRGDDCAKFYCDLITIKEMDELDAITKVRIEHWMKLLNSACESITEWQ